MKTKIRFLVQVAFVACIGLIFLAGFARTALAPKEINSYENRKANPLPPLSLEGFLSGEFQDDVELALNDQVQLAEAAKRFYNQTESKLALSAMRGVFEGNPEKVFTYNGLMTTGGDYILYWPRTVDASGEKIAQRAENIKSLVNAYPDLDFFLYYIEKDTDFNIRTGEKQGLYEFLMSEMGDARCSCRRFEVGDFETYAQYFYKTDHHWNHRGSYKAYLEVRALLGITEPAVEPEEEFLVNHALSGSKAAEVKASGVWTEEMYAYKFRFPEMDVAVNGEAAEDYGQQNLPGMGTQSYGGYYGGDGGEVILDCHQPEKPNILVIGESYDNAILKLLASHYNKTFSIDLRNYEHRMGQTFSFHDYVEKNNIDLVLFIGNIDFLVSADFLVEE